MELVVGDTVAATFDVSDVTTWAVGTVTDTRAKWVDADFNDGASWVKTTKAEHGKTWHKVVAI